MPNDFGLPNGEILDFTAGNWRQAKFYKNFERINQLIFQFKLIVCPGNTIPRVLGHMSCKVVKCGCHYISRMNHQIELQFEDVIKVLKSDDKTFIKWISEQNIIPNIHQVHFCGSVSPVHRLYTLFN